MRKQRVRNQRRLAASGTPAPAIRIAPETRSAISCTRPESAARARAAPSAQSASPAAAMNANVARAARAAHACPPRWSGTAAGRKRARATALFRRSMSWMPVKSVLGDLPRWWRNLMFRIAAVEVGIVDCQFIADDDLADRHIPECARLAASRHLEGDGGPAPYESIREMLREGFQQPHVAEAALQERRNERCRHRPQ